MPEYELVVSGRGGARLPATLTLPEAVPVRAALVPLHPASEPERGQFLFRHLAERPQQLGVAVLRFGRRRLGRHGLRP